MFSFQPLMELFSWKGTLATGWDGFSRRSNFPLSAGILRFGATNRGLMAFPLRLGRKQLLALACPFPQGHVLG